MAKMSGGIGMMGMFGGGGGAWALGMPPRNPRLLRILQDKQKNWNPPGPLYTLLPCQSWRCLV